MIAEPRIMFVVVASGNIIRVDGTGVIVYSFPFQKQNKLEYGEYN